ncbi:hypothetical protein CYY_008556 [Polysphondylium violaceum]|uniref:MACPF domain-containing protein n=1 Tax=Polysphondylium violaceum TaxID=133409 RepID=A0A8J4UQ36_9MYCE|nr:hypothetical protein CYY_008556 [Polysphondylium violaceum]
MKILISLLLLYIFFTAVFTTPSLLLKKRLDPGPSDYSNTGCENSKYYLVLKDLIPLKSITSLDNNVGLSFQIKNTENDSFLVELKLSLNYSNSPISTNIKVINTLNEESIFSLDNLSCLPPQTEILALAPPVLDFFMGNAYMIFNIDIDEQIYRPGLSCLSNFGDCSASQIQPNQIIVFIFVNSTIVSYKALTFKLLNLFSNVVFEIQFDNPLKSDMATYMIEQDGKWSDPNSENNNYLVKVQRNGTMGDFLIFGDTIYSTELFVPVLGNEEKQMGILIVNFPEYKSSASISFYRMSPDPTNSLLKTQTIQKPTLSFPPFVVETSLTLDGVNNVLFFKAQASGMKLNTPTSFTYHSTLKTLPFPYGFTKVANQFLFTPVQMFGRLSSYDIRFFSLHNIGNQKFFKSIQLPSSSPIDNKEPTLVRVLSKKVFEQYISFKVHLADEGSGIFTITNGATTVYALDSLVSGSLNDGVFELVLNKFDYSNRLDLGAYDLYGQYSTFVENVPMDFNLEKIDQIYSDICPSISEIIEFELSSNKIDSSYQERGIYIFFKLSSGDNSMKPMVQITESNGIAEIFVGEFDHSIQKYRIKISVFRKSHLSTIQYILFLNQCLYTSYSLRSKFGETANIKKIRSDVDSYPPMINQVAFINGQSINVSSTIEIGWLISIKDKPSGLQYGNITVVSDVDPYPRDFTFDVSSVNRNKFDSSYEIKFNVSVQHLNQTFKISSVYLEDSLGRKSIYPSGAYKTLSPFYELGVNNYDITIITPKVAEQTPPEITSFSYTTATNNMYTFVVKAQDVGSGININRPPVVFVQSYQALYQNFTTKYVSKIGNTVTFEVVAQIDFKMTFHGCHLSVYGVYDNDLNLSGYSSLDLKNLGYNHFIKTAYIPGAFIKSTSPISQVGGRLTIHGIRFKENSLVYLNNQLVEPLFICSIAIVIDVEPMVDSFEIKISTNTIDSNIFVVIPSLVFHSNILFVDPNSTCTNGCGGFVNPYSTIKAAIHISQSFNTIILKDGVYSGNLNTGLDVFDGKPLQIKSLNGKSKTIIDCEGYSYFLKVLNSLLLSLTEITITNCKSNKGGALYLQETDSILTSVQFVNNQASNGGAIYFFQSKASLKDIYFENNKVLKNGAAIYSYLSDVLVKGDLTVFRNNQNINSKQSRDILCRNSSIEIQDEVPFDKSIFKCMDSCDPSYLHRSLCQDVAQKSIPSKPLKCGDGECNGAESCLSCPNDCSCHYNGLVQEIFNPTCVVTNSSLKSCQSIRNTTLSPPFIENFLGGVDNVVVRLFGYVSVGSSKILPLMLQGTNFGLIFKINGVPKLSFNQNTRFNETVSVFLTSKYAHFIEIILFSKNVDGPQRSFILAPFADPKDRLFYSNLNCGDGILHDEEQNETSRYYCPVDHKYPQYKLEPRCGDGICNEEPNSCYMDCFQELTKTCPARTVPENHLSPGFYYSEDTLGDLISNQFIWRLPGSEHLSFGMDIMTGEEAPSPLFQFDYCQHIANNIIEDPYRGNVYQIPPELSGKAYPQCTYSTSTDSFNSVQEMSNSQESSSKIDFSAEVEASGGFISGGGGIGFSLEKSSKEASKLSTNVNQRIFKTDLLCKTTFLEIDLDRISIHPKLLSDFSNIKDSVEMVGLIKKYGTHFYKKTFMGGKLTHFTITDESEVNTENESEWQESASASLSASVSGPSFSVDASVEASVDKSQSDSSQSQKSESSTTSRILVYGGTPAAFSPASDFSSSPGFTEWASSIDVLPVPIDYQLYPIRHILNQNWVNKYGINIAKTWADAENIFYAMNNIDQTVSATEYYSLIFQWHTPESTFTMKDYPILKIDYEIVEKNILTGELVHKVKTFSTPIVLTYTDCRGNKEKVFFSHKKQNNYDSSICSSEEAFDTDNSLNYKTTYKICDPTFSTNMDGPIRFDFVAPDFFNSATEPNIQIIVPDQYSNLVFINYTNPLKIVSWENSEAILFDNAGIIYSNSKYYGTVAFENKWGWHWNPKYRVASNNNLYEHDPNQPYNDEFNGFKIVDKHLDCTPDVILACKDYIELSFGGYGNNFDGVKTKNPNTKISTIEIPYTGQGTKQGTYWFNIHNDMPPGDVPLDVFYIENLSHIGMHTRINWIQMYMPRKINEWKFDVSAYHLKSYQNKTMIANEWLEINVDPMELYLVNGLTPHKFYPLTPLASSEPKQLFFYPNYNFRARDQQKLNPSIVYPYYLNLCPDKNPQFYEDGEIFSYV